MIATLLLAATTLNPYGVAAHVTRTEGTPPRLERTIGALRLAGMGYVRTDVDASAILRDGAFDFTGYDRIFGELAKNGIAVLPILNGRHGKEPPVDFDEYRAYLTAIMTHYRGRFPVVEIWNEANLNNFFIGADPALYAKTLQVSYEAVKAADPSVRVAFTGTAGIPIDWIRKAFESGAGRFFDIMNVHPYTHPRAPEGEMDVRLEALGKLMAEFGLSDKPIWITEIGWPTHEQRIDHASILLAGLKVARPGQESWRVMLVDCSTRGKPSQTQAQKLLDLLPAGSQVEALNQVDAVARLSADAYDAVVYPFDESFPADTIDAVNRFIAEGGVLVDMGGLPCYHGMRDGARIEGLRDGGAVRRFPFGFGAAWTHKGLYPESVRVFATERGLAAGVKQEPTGFQALRFVRPDNAGEHEWIPLVSARATNGTELVAAGVIRYRGARKGAAVLCSLFAGKGVSGTNDEANQARYTARALGISFAEKVEAYFAYNLRAVEADPYYSEHHFGLMHADFQPKPAFSAYAQFIQARPAGSVNLDIPWHDEGRTLYHPQWMRPDGKVAGMVWQASGDARRELSFADGTPTFQDMFGRRIAPRDLGKGRYALVVGGSPVYFLGARLVDAQKLL